MATSARSSAQRSAGIPRQRIPHDLVNELRAIVSRSNTRQAYLQVADFVSRHGLSHRDVDALVSAMKQNDAVSAPTTSRAAPTATVPATNEPAATLHDPGASEDTSIAPLGSAEEADPHALDSDLGWMFGDEPEFPAPRAANDIVGQAFDDLMGDWTRTGGQLTRAEVALLATRRKLSPTQHGELLELLEEAGVELPDPTDPRPQRAAHKGYEFQGDLIGQYLHTLSRYPLIDATREVELWSLISQGVAAQQELDAAGEDGLALSVRQSLQTQVVAGRHAHAELVCANLRLVVSIAKARRYQSSGVEFADRVQDGNLGLMRAADKFDGSKGFKFSTYATWWIKQSIERGIGDRGRLIRIPMHAHEQVLKVRRAVSRLTARLDREPTLTEISELTGMEPGKVQWALDLDRPVISIDMLLGEEGDLRLSDVLVSYEDRDGRTDPAEIVIHAMFHRDVTRTLRSLLPERSVRILERRFGLGTGDEETLDSIAADYDCTREWIRQIQARALKTLQKSQEAAALQSYMIDDSKVGGSMGREAS